MEDQGATNGALITKTGCWPAIVSGVQLGGLGRKGEEGKEEKMEEDGGVERRVQNSETLERGGADSMDVRIWVSRFPFLGHFFTVWLVCVLSSTVLKCCRVQKSTWERESELDEV